MFVRILPWLSILALAVALRVFGLRYGLPAVYNPDEVAIMSRALAFAKGDLNPHNFLYPSLYFYVLFAWEGLTAALAVATRAVDSFAAFQREFFLDPTRVFVAGRLLTAILGTATVAATGLLARRLAGPLAGIAAALVVAVSPLHVRDSHYVKHDVPVTLVIVLAYLAYARLYVPPKGGSHTPIGVPPKGGSYTPGDVPPEGGSYTSGEVPPKGGSYTETGGFRLQAEVPLLLAAGVTGLAFSTHYYAIFLAIPLAWSAARGAKTTTDAVTRVAIAAITSAVIFFLCSPFILAEPLTALRDIQANRQIVVDRAVESLGYGATLARYGAMLVRDTIGWPFVAAAAIGLIVSLRERPLRTAWLLAFPIPFFLFIAGTFPASRYLIPLVPFLAVFAGLAVAAMARANGTAAWVTLALLAVLPLQASVKTDAFIRHTDTRTLARAFVEAHVPDGATILTQPYSVPLEPTAASLREAVARSGREMPTKTRLQIERTPYPSPAYRLIYVGRGMDADKLYLPQEALQADPLRSLGAEHVAFLVLKRYNDEAPAMLPLTAALAREGRRLAVFSPYRADAATRPEPFLHNTDARITAALERSGPVVEIWQINGPRS